MPPYARPVSKAQASLWGAELARLRRGEKGTLGMSIEELEGKLRGANVSALPERVKRKDLKAAWKKRMKKK